MTLTADNYYSVEADREYMSCSQYQDFLNCEAATMAKLYTGFKPKTSEALIVGNYLHTALESEEAHRAFCEQYYYDIFKTKTDKKTGEVIQTGMYAPYQKADEMIAVMRSDPLIKGLIEEPGQNEVIMTGKLFGTKWKIRLDKYIPDKRVIIDWKTAADLTRTEYDPATGTKASFLEFLGYLMRAAIYSEIEKQYSNSSEDPKFIIVAVTKQDPPDKGAYLLNHRMRYDSELERVRDNMVRILRVKSGQVKPRRCGVCEYCRSTKRLKKILPYYTLTPGYQEEREEEYDDIFTGYMEDAQNAPMDR